MLKESMSQLPLQSKAEKSRDGTSDTTMMNLLVVDKEVKVQVVMVKMIRTEDLKLANHSSFNPDCGCKELLLTTPITTPILPQERMQRTKCGFMIKLQRLLSLYKITRNLLITEEDTLPSKTPILDGTNCGLIFQLDISKLMFLEKLVRSNMLWFNLRLTQK
jgi:hypothetical protein